MNPLPLIHIEQVQAGTMAGKWEWTVFHDGGYDVSPNWCDTEEQAKAEADAWVDEHCPEDK